MKKIAIFITVFCAVFIVDQTIKLEILNGFRWDSRCFSITLAFNKGVAFSLLAFLEGYLKYLQLLLVGALFGYVFYKKLFDRYYLPLAILGAAAISNIFDRFNRGAVVDYLYYHCGFEFAIFNFADMMIDLSVVLILWIYYGKRV